MAVPDFDFGWQVADKGNADLNLVDRMAFIKDPVFELDVPAIYPDIRYGEAKMDLGYLNVGEIEPVRLVANDVHGGSLECDLLDDKR
jgi:hypothetical protein